MIGAADTWLKSTKVYQFIAITYIHEKQIRKYLWTIEDFYGHYYYNYKFEENYIGGFTGLNITREEDQQQLRARAAVGEDYKPSPQVLYSLQMCAAIW